MDGAPEDQPFIRLDDAIALVAERMVCDQPKHKTACAKEALKAQWRKAFRREGRLVVARLIFWKPDLFVAPSLGKSRSKRLPFEADRGHDDASKALAQMLGWPYSRAMPCIWFTTRVSRCPSSTASGLAGLMNHVQCSIRCLSCALMCCVSSFSETSAARSCVRARFSSPL